jgi:hypothetical protein
VITSLVFFRPGVEARMLARCQFGMNHNAQGVILTYPIKGCPWRRNIMKHYSFDLSPEKVSMLFLEVDAIRKNYPDECLSIELLWSDSSEKANGITRDRATNTLCYSIMTWRDLGGQTEAYESYESFAMRENSSVLLNSELYKTISELIKPFERL